MKRKRAKKPPKILHYEELEQRLLFSADVAPGLDKVAAPDPVPVENSTSDVKAESESGNGCFTPDGIPSQEEEKHASK